MNLIEAIAMTRRKGLRLVATNIKERLVFDLLNGIDTTTQVPKDEFKSRPAHFEHGLHYSSSWTSEIKFGFRVARRYLGPRFKNHAFIDIGCGKGKVQIVWTQLLRRVGDRQRIVGIDYDDALLGEAAANHRKALGCEGDFIHADAATFDFHAIGTGIIVYLYNPFDDLVMRKVLRAMRGCDAVVIYNNPEHRGVLVEEGFWFVGEKQGFHPQGSTIVYARAAAGR